MIRITFLLVLLTTLPCYVASSSNNTLQLPITINPLLQDSIQLSSFANALIKENLTFFEHVTFNDIVKILNLPIVPQLEKSLEALVVLGLAAIEHGLTLDQLEFFNTSKWTIVMTVEDLANVSKSIILPLTDKIPFIKIQEAMFTILERRFNFETKEVADRLNTTTDEIYAFFEPGWIKVVNFITEKNVLALSRNYTIPPFYIAAALNMSLPELYNSTLPQLEDILANKIDIIREAAEKYRRSVSIAGLLHASSAFSTVVSTILPINNTAVSVMMENTTTLAIKPSFTMKTEAKTSSNFNEISSYHKMSKTLSKDLNSTSMQRLIQIPTKTKSISMYYTPVSLTITEVPHSERSTTIQTHFKSRSVKNQVSTTKQHTSMFQSITTDFVLLTSTEMVSTITSKSTIPSKSIRMPKMVSVTSQSSPDLAQKASSKMMDISSTRHMTSSEMIPTATTMPEMVSVTSKSSHDVGRKTSLNIMSISITQQMTSSEMMPTATTLLESSSMSPKPSYTMHVSSSNGLSKSMVQSSSKSMVNTVQSSSLGKTFSYLSQTKNVHAMKSSSMLEIISTVATSFVMTTSSHFKNTPTSKLPTSSQVTKTSTFISEGMTSSQFSENAQTTSSETLSSHFVLDMKTSTEGHSTSSRYQQISSNLESSPAGVTSTADVLVLKTTTVAVKPSLSHATPSSSHVQVAVTSSTPIVVGNTVDARSEDEMDPVILIVIPILAVLFLAAIVVALVMWLRHRRRRMSANNNNAERGSELSSKGLVESLENLNNARTTGFVNRGADDRSSRSMSRTSSVSNLETIQEGNEPETPEIYDL